MGLDKQYAVQAAQQQAVCDAASDRASTMTERLAGQLGELNGSLEEAYTRLEARYVTLFGHRPQPPPAVSNQVKLSAVSSHVSGELTESAGSALNKVYGLHGLITDLLAVL